MSEPLLLLITGMAVVIGAILIARLPAFLALVGAAWLTAALTPESDSPDNMLQNGKCNQPIPMQPARTVT